MKVYNTTYAVNRPKEVEITSDRVFVASNIEQISRTVDGITEECYSFTLKEYTKDEYLIYLTEQNAELIDELAATKIILGVE